MNQPMISAGFGRFSRISLAFGLFTVLICTAASANSTKTNLESLETDLKAFQEQISADEAELEKKKEALQILNSRLSLQRSIDENLRAFRDLEVQRIEMLAVVKDVRAKIDGRLLPGEYLENEILKMAAEIAAMSEEVSIRFDQVVGQEAATLEFVTQLSELLGGVGPRCKKITVKLIRVRQLLEGLDRFEEVIRSQFLPSDPLQTSDAQNKALKKMFGEVFDELLKLDIVNFDRNIRINGVRIEELNGMGLPRDSTQSWYEMDSELKSIFLFHRLEDLINRLETVSTSSSTENLQKIRKLQLEWLALLVHPAMAEVAGPNISPKYFNIYRVGSIRETIDFATFPVRWLIPFFDLRLYRSHEELSRGFRFVSFLGAALFLTTDPFGLIHSVPSWSAGASAARAVLGVFGMITVLPHLFLSSAAVLVATMRVVIDGFKFSKNAILRGRVVRLQTKLTKFSDRMRTELKGMSVCEFYLR